MRVMGHRSEDGQVLAVDLRPSGSARVLGTLRRFWADPLHHLDPGTPTTGDVLAPEELALVPPALPEAKVLCIGLNYADHVAEGSFAAAGLPEHPTVFARWTDSLSTSGAPVSVPPGEEGLDWEGEVVAWVGTALDGAGVAEAREAVVGYSVFNDLTARGAQKRTSQWTLGKNVAGSGPLGPLHPRHEVGDLDQGLRLTTRVNGRTVQDASTASMIFGVAETLAEISRTVALKPGDLVATGTPSGVGYARSPRWLLGPGDVVEVEVERLGTISTPVVCRPGPA